MNENYNYNTIDLIKFTSAFFIVGIHANILNVSESKKAWLISSMFFRLAVPLFFAFSGYFLAAKVYRIGKNRKAAYAVLKEYCKNLLTPLIFWGGVGLVFHLFDEYEQGKSLLYLLAYSLRTIFYPMNAMWFIWACIIGSIIIVNIYIRFNRWKLILFALSATGYCVVLLCNNYFFLVQDCFIGDIINMYLKLCVSARNGVFLAPIFMGIGFFLKELDYKNAFNCFNKKLLLLALAAGFLALYIEASCLYNLAYRDDRGYFVSFVVLIPTVVLVALNYNIQIKLNYKLLRRLSTSIYFLHASIIFLLEEFSMFDGCTIFFLTVIACIFISLFSYQINSRMIRRVLG